MRIVNWNIEWMNDLFVPGTAAPTFRQRVDNPERPVADVAAHCRKIADVVRALAADVLIVQEGPSARAEMQLFLDTFLPGYQAFGGFDGRAQKIYLMVSDSGAFAQPALADDGLAADLADAWEADIDGDLVLAEYKFTRRPVVVTGSVNGRTVTVVGVHMKSNFVNRGQELWLDPARRPEYIRQALVNRRRISAEDMRLRDYLDAAIDRDPQALIVVGGDFNDGPGRDYFELRYLTHNVTDLVLGSTFHPRKIFRHAFLDAVSDEDLYTVIFDDFVDEVPNRRIILDHILVSPALAPTIESGNVDHAILAQNGAVFGDSNRMLRVSDHVPVSAQLAL